MEQLISLEKLYLSLKDIIETNEDVELVKDIIINLHYTVQQIRLCKKDTYDIDMETLGNVSMYLLSTLTNITSEHMREYVKDFFSEGLNISALIFELLAQIESDPLKKHYQLFYCSVCYSLSDKEASSAVMGKSIIKNIKDNNLFAEFESAMECWKSISLTLSRNFKELYKQRDIDENIKYIKKNDYWRYLNSILVQNSCCFVDGESYEKIFAEISYLKSFLLNLDHIEALFVLSLISDVLEKMYSKSVWNVLPPLGFSNKYLSILTKYDSKNIYEIWNSQLGALKYSSNNLNYLCSDVNRILISMPTSAGKSFIAELAMVNVLESNNELKCIYVASTRALSSEVENNLFYRFRKLGYNVSAVIDTDENDYENDLLKEVNVLVVTPEKLDLLVRRNKDFLKNLGIIIFDEFHKVSDNSRGWLLETLLAWFFINQQQFSYKVILMSAIISNVNELNKWIGNNDFKPITSDWSPNRRIYGVVRKHSEEDNKWIDIKENVKQLQIPYMLIYKYSDKKRFIEDIFIEEAFFKRPKRKTHFQKDDTKSDTKFDRCFKFIKYLNDSKILIYFFQKSDLQRFIEYSKYYLDVKNDDRLKILQDFLQLRLGREHPLVNNIIYGIAYHHGDLPIEVRKEIEKSYKQGIIDILACTTTLSDGVNLPIKNFILGSFNSYNNEHRLSIADFKNIVGRAGRAYIDTEGRIFLIRHPDYSKAEINEHFLKLLYCDREQTNVVSSLDKEFSEVYDVLDELEEIVDETQKEHAKTALDIIDRLQVFTFSLYEDYKSGLLVYDNFCDIFEKNLLFSYQTNEVNKKRFNVLCGKYYTFADGIDINIIKKFNKTGLSYKSNNILKEITQELSRIEDNFEYSLNNIVTKDIFNKIISMKEIMPKTYKYKVGIKSAEYEIDHYAAFFDWINGNSFLEIRDSIFIQDKNISNRTQTCVNYINDMFIYKLPWAFSALYVMSMGSLFIIDSILRSLPAIIKYGVDDHEAIKLCTLGMESRELAKKLTKLYDEDITKESQTLENWLLEKGFYFFEKNISGIDEISIRQISKVRTKLRKRSTFLSDIGVIECDIAGITFSDYRELFYKRAIDINTALILFQERENPYDEYAVRVDMPNGEKIGYIPSEFAEEVFDNIEADQSLGVKIINITYRKITIEISVENYL